MTDANGPGAATRESYGEIPSSSTRPGSPSLPAPLAEHGFNFLCDLAPADYLGWVGGRRRRLHRHGDGARPERSRIQGLGALARSRSRSASRSPTTFSA